MICDVWTEGGRERGREGGVEGGVGGGEMCHRYTADWTMLSLNNMLLVVKFSLVQNEALSMIDKREFCIFFPFFTYNIYVCIIICVYVNVHIIYTYVCTYETIILYNSV